MILNKAFIIRRTAATSVSAYDAKNDKVYHFTGPIAFFVLAIRKLETISPAHLALIKQEMLVLNPALVEEELAQENLEKGIEYLLMISLILPT